MHSGKYPPQYGWKQQSTEAFIIAVAEPSTDVRRELGIQATGHLFYFSHRSSIKFIVHLMKHVVFLMFVRDDEVALQLPGQTSVLTADCWPRDDGQ